jgi:hypothetical protein
MIVAPGVAKGIDMRAQMQRQHDRVFGKLKPTRPLGTGRIIPAITTHKVHDPSPMARDRQTVRDDLA